MKTISMPIEEYEKELRDLKLSAENSGFIRGVEVACAEIEHGIRRPDLREINVKNQQFLTDRVVATVNRIRHHFAIGKLRRTDSDEIV